MLSLVDFGNGISADVLTCFDKLPDNLNGIKSVIPSEYAKLTGRSDFPAEMSCGEFDDALSSVDCLWTYSPEYIDEASTDVKMVLVRLTDGFLLAELPFDM